MYCPTPAYRLSSRSSLRSQFRAEFQCVISQHPGDCIGNLSRDVHPDIPAAAILQDFPAPYLRRMSHPAMLISGARPNWFVPSGTSAPAGAGLVSRSSSRPSCTRNFIADIFRHKGRQMGNSPVHVDIIVSQAIDAILRGALRLHSVWGTPSHPVIRHSRVVAIVHLPIQLGEIQCLRSRSAERDPSAFHYCKPLLILLYSRRRRMPDRAGHTFRRHPGSLQIETRWHRSPLLALYRRQVGAGDRESPDNFRMEGSGSAVRRLLWDSRRARRTENCACCSRTSKTRTICL